MKTEHTILKWLRQSSLTVFVGFFLGFLFTSSNGLLFTALAAFLVAFAIELLGIHLDTRKPYWEKFLSTPAWKISEKQWLKAKERAEHWSTCACGGMDAGIPRRLRTDPEPWRAGEPFDNELRALGIEFCTQIVMRDLRSARRTFRQIEWRARDILRDQKVNSEL